jgi:hypothetical protein
MNSNRGEFINMVGLAKLLRASLYITPNAQAPAFFET